LHFSLNAFLFMSSRAPQIASWEPEDAAASRGRGGGNNNNTTTTTPPRLLKTAKGVAPIGYYNEPGFSRHNLGMKSAALAIYLCPWPVNRPAL
jgi:hypothetical protein